MNERQIIQACQNGDRNAQRLFFDRYYRSIFLLAKRYLSDHHDTEDLVLIVFEKAFRKLDYFEYRGKGSMGKWLRTIAINESIRLIKKVRPMYYPEGPIEGGAEPEDLGLLDVERVYQILATMPDGYRTVFNLYAIEGYSHSEIAELLNISRNTSKSQLLKARKFIIRELNQKKDYGT